MGCTHDGIIKEEIRKRFIYPDDPNNGEWEILSRIETCEHCGEIANQEPDADPHNPRG